MRSERSVSSGIATRQAPRLANPLKRAATWSREPIPSSTAPPVRRSASAAAAILTIGLAACHVTSAPPRTSIAGRTAPIPLAVRVCDQTVDGSADAVLDAARLFERATSDPAAPADLIAIVGPVDSTERTLVSSGFFLWTLGVIPWMKREERDVQVTFHRATADAPCSAPAVAGAGAPAVALRSKGRVTTVQGWAALLLQPLPGWSGDAYDFQQPRTQRARNLRLRTREALSREIIARAAEIRALAGR